MRAYREWYSKGKGEFHYVRIYQVFSLGGTCPQNTIPSPLVRRRKGAGSLHGWQPVKGCIYNNAEWFLNNFETDKLIKMIATSSYFHRRQPWWPREFICGDRLSTENDHLVFSETSFVFVPGSGSPSVRLRGLHFVSPYYPYRQQFL